MLFTDSSQNIHSFFNLIDYNAAEGFFHELGLVSSAGLAVDLDF